MTECRRSLISARSRKKHFSGQAEDVIFGCSASLLSESYTLLSQCPGTCHSPRSAAFPNLPGGCLLTFWAGQILASTLFQLLDAAGNRLDLGEKVLCKKEDG